MTARCAMRGGHLLNLMNLTREGCAPDRVGALHGDNRDKKRLPVLSHTGLAREHLGFGRSSKGG